MKRALYIVSGFLLATAIAWAQTHTVLTNDQQFLVSNNRSLTGNYQCSGNGSIDDCPISGGPIQPAELPFSGLPTCNATTQGTIYYCTDCIQAGVCAGGGTGALAICQDGAWTCASSGTGGSAGGADTNVQFNQAGSLGGNSSFTFDYTNKRVALSSLTTATDNATQMVSIAGTLPAVPSTGVAGVSLSITGAGSVAQAQVAEQVFFNPGYTGASSATGSLTYVNIANNGALTFDYSTADTSPTALYAVQAISDPATVTKSQNSIGVYGEGRLTSLRSIGVLGRAWYPAGSNNDGTRIGVMGTAGASVEATDLKSVGILGTLASSLPVINSDFAGFFDGGPVGIWNQNALRFFESGGVNYAAFRAAASIGSDITWTLPATDSTGTQALVSNGSGTLAWQSISRSAVVVGGCETGGSDGFGPVIGVTGDTCPASEADAQISASAAGTMTNLYCNVTTAPGIGNQWVVTLRKAGVSQTLTCTITGAATTCNDTTHSFSFAQGDLLSALFDQTTAAGTPVLACNAQVAWS